MDWHMAHDMAWQGVEGEVKKPEAYGVVTPWVKVNPVRKRSILRCHFTLKTEH